MCNYNYKYINNNKYLPDFIDISIFLISPYKITANQDSAISQKVIKTPAIHNDMILTSDLVHPQESVCFILTVPLNLCFL